MMRSYHRHLAVRYYIALTNFVRADVNVSPAYLVNAGNNSNYSS